MLVMMTSVIMAKMTPITAKTIAMKMNTTLATTRKTIATRMRTTLATTTKITAMIIMKTTMIMKGMTTMIVMPLLLRAEIRAAHLQANHPRARG